VNVKDGDFLLAIDGTDVKVPENPFRLLQVTKGQKVKLMVGPKADGTGSRTVEIEPLRSEYDLRYDRWVSRNLTYVDKASNGQIGYLHLTAMSAENIAQFDRFFRAFHDRKGLVIDVRGNGGGWVEYYVIDKLERKTVARNVLKNMEPFRYPPGTTDAHPRGPLQRVQRLGRRGVRGALQGEQARHRHRRAVVGRARRDRQRAGDDRRRVGAPVEQRVLRAGRQVADREPWRGPGYPPRRRPGLRLGREDLQLGQGDRGS